jgi:hypothetical protein
LPPYWAMPYRTSLVLAVSLAPRYPTGDSPRFPLALIESMPPSPFEELHALLGAYEG